MKTISQYKDDIKNLMKKSCDIDAKATNEDRDLSESELSLKNEILDQVDETEKTVRTLERQERLSKKLEAPEPSITNKGNVSFKPDLREQDRFTS